MEAITSRNWTVEPLLSTYLFWDTDKKQLDFVKNSIFVIRRVFELGTVDDVSEVLAYYDRQHIINALISAVSLKENAVYLASVLFKIPFEKFKCYTSIKNIEPE